MTTATDLSLLLRCYDRTPGDWTLVAALADAFAEVGDEDFAEGCRWVLEKRRRPYLRAEVEVLGIRCIYDAGWSRNDNPFDNTLLRCCYLPPPVTSMFDCSHNFGWCVNGSDAASVMLRRLLDAWRLAADEEKVAAWKQEPV